MIINVDYCYSFSKRWIGWSIFQTQKRKMTVAEQPCYTLINTSQDLESPTEMQLREDLEKGNDKVS